MIGGRLRNFREKRGLTVTAFASLIGISHGSLSDIENGKTKPSADTIASIVRNTNVNPYWLLTGKPPPEIPPDTEGAGSRYFTVRIEGEAAAGPPRNQLYLDYEEELVLPKNLRKGVGREDVAAIRVVGKSMEPELRHGDIVIVYKEAPAPDRIDRDKLYCVYVEAEKGFVVKRVEYRAETNEFVLLPLNPSSRVQFIKRRRGRNPIVGWVMAAWKTSFPKAE